MVAKNQNSHRWPHFLPDNRHFIFWARNAQGAAEQAIYLGSLDSREIKKILTGVSTATYESGYLLFQRDQTLLAQAFDTERLAEMRKGRVVNHEEVVKRLERTGRARP